MLHKEFYKEKSNIVFLVMTLLLVIAVVTTSNFDSPTGRLFGTETTTTNLIVNQEFTEQGSIPFDKDLVTSIKITGTYTGEGTFSVYAESDGGRALVYTYSAGSATNSLTGYQVYEETTEQTETTTEEPIIEQTTEEPIEEPVAEETTETTDEEPVAEEPIVEETNETEPTIEEPVIEQPIAPIEVAFTFEKVCVDTCTLMNVKINSLSVEMTEGELNIESVEYTTTAEQNVKLIKPIDDKEITLEQTISINLEEYFEGEEIFFDGKSSEGYTYTINNNVITYTPRQIGTWNTHIYALSGEDIITSNEFKIIITSVETEPIENETTPLEPVENETIIPTENETIINETQINETIIIDDNLTINITINETINETIINETLENLTQENVSLTLEELCAEPNPNLRPLECLQLNDSYFKPEDLLIENKAGIVVAKFTPIGNMLIKGDYIENSQQQASQSDYQLGYVNSNGDFVATVWIDSQTGDLHLKGKLTEANNNIAPEIGLSVIANKREVVLAVINRQIGDMTIRGNIVPFRRSFE